MITISTEKDGTICNERRSEVPKLKVEDLSQAPITGIANLNYDERGNAQNIWRIVSNVVIQGSKVKDEDGNESDDWSENDDQEKPSQNLVNKMLHQYNENELKEKYVNQALTYGVPIKKHGNHA